MLRARLDCKNILFTDIEIIGSHHEQVGCDGNIMPMSNVIMPYSMACLITAKDLFPVLTQIPRCTMKWRSTLRYEISQRELYLLVQSAESLDLRNEMTESLLSKFVPLAICTLLYSLISVVSQRPTDSIIPTVYSLLPSQWNHHTSKVMRAPMKSPIFEMYSETSSSETTLESYTTKNRAIRSLST